MDSNETLALYHKKSVCEAVIVDENMTLLTNTY